MALTPAACSATNFKNCLVVAARLFLAGRPGYTGQLVIRLNVHNGTVASAVLDAPEHIDFKGGGAAV